MHLNRAEGVVVLHEAWGGDEHAVTPETNAELRPPHEPITHARCQLFVGVTPSP